MVSCCDRYGVGEARDRTWWATGRGSISKFSVVVVAPGPDPAVALHGCVVKPTRTGCGAPGEVGDFFRGIDIESPLPNGPVILQGQCKVNSVNSPYIAQERDLAGYATHDMGPISQLSVVVATPGPCCPVVVDEERTSEACENAQGIGDANRSYRRKMA